MDYYGDESGHLKSILTGDCDFCVIGVVAGDGLCCARCPKKTVRRVDDIPEAKWNDLRDHQKRRLFECFSEQEEMRFGFAVFTEEKLHSMENYHLLYENVKLPPAWDLALSGYAYGEILYEMGARDQRRPIFEFDRVSSKKQSEHIKAHLDTFVPDLSGIFIQGSRQSSGIQAADCFAGGIAEDLKKDTEWLEYLDEEKVTEVSYASLIKLEKDLSDYRTGP